MLTHWGRATHICVIKLTIIGSENGLSPGRRQAILWTNAGISLIRPLGTNFNEILIEILIFLFKEMRLKVSSAKWRPFCLGLNVLITLFHPSQARMIKFVHCPPAPLSVALSNTQQLIWMKWGPNKMVDIQETSFWNAFPWMHISVIRWWFLQSFFVRFWSSVVNCFFTWTYSEPVRWHLYTSPSIRVLTHLPLVPHICVSESSQHWFR